MVGNQRYEATTDKIQYRELPGMPIDSVLTVLFYNRNFI